MSLKSFRVALVIRRDPDQYQRYELKLTGLLIRAKIQGDQPFEIEQNDSSMLLNILSHYTKHLLVNGKFLENRQHYW